MRDMFSRSNVELVLTTSTIYIYMHSSYPHTRTSWFGYMTHFLDPLFDLTTYALQVCMRGLHTYELHISFISYRWEREGITLLLPWWESKNTTYLKRLERVIQRNFWVLLLKTDENSRLDCFVFQLFTTQVNVKAPWFKVIWCWCKRRYQGMPVDLTYKSTKMIIWIIWSRQQGCA
jgi:hypothetical protein